MEEGEDDPQSSEKVVNELDKQSVQRDVKKTDLITNEKRLKRPQLKCFRLS